MMASKLLLFCCCGLNSPTFLSPSHSRPHPIHLISFKLRPFLGIGSLTAKRRSPNVVCAAMQPLDLTEENIEKVLADARTELAQLFDESVGITGQAELAELDGPFVKIRLRGRFWHKRSTVLARLDNYLKQRIPEILEVEIEDEKQLDDSPANF